MDITNVADYIGQIGDLTRNNMTTPLEADLGIGIILLAVAAFLWLITRA